jgi:hypothetical protein
MKKSLALLFLSFTIACSAWAEKYEYVRVTKDQVPVTLNSGDVAWCVNAYSYNEYILTYDMDGNVLSSDRLSYGGGAGETSSFVLVDRTFVGPCKLGPYYDHQRHYHMDWAVFKILRASESGNKTLEWDGSEYASTTISDSSDGSQQANNGVDPTNIQYDELFGWAYFTDSNWVYSYTNLSWYYMHSIDGDIYVWNANLPDNGWTKWTRS